MNEPIPILYQDRDILIVLKPSGVLSTDEPGGLPQLVRETLGDPEANVRTVHRLDRVVSGLVVLARRAKAAAALSRQIREDTFEKEYLAVVHGHTPERTGTFRDLLLRNKAERKTYVVSEPGKDVQEAVLDYERLAETEHCSLVRITLRTGRTHQIRCQFSARGLPLVGDRKYGNPEASGPIALWSHRLAFDHPWSGQRMEFTQPPPVAEPWNQFQV